MRYAVHMFCYAALSAAIWAQAAGMLPSPTQALSFVTLAYPGASNTGATGINNKGWVVGQYSIGSSAHGFLYVDGAYASFDVPGAVYTWPQGINDLGQVVGTYADSGGNHGFLRTAQGYTTIDYPGQTLTYLKGINSTGQIVGFFEDPVTAVAQSFLYQAGQFTLINYPGAVDTAAYGINSLGQVAGEYVSSDGQFGFTYGNGVFTTVTVPHTDNPVLTGINAQGKIIGYAQFRKNHTLVEEGFIDVAGSFRQFTFSGVGAFPSGVNNQGQMVGNYFLGDTGYGFLASPAATK